ncbi:hypothetical protein [Streptomyces sp. LaPpAH-108]|uniref:hypothetical protein n=1 Tax=Streptomyces sp. LaPpAH-108 TaxID=1155714 RepID=UPI001319F6B1|nr:hypothetical protein [Streptomyces sp. LaPpAH-108]
MNDTTKIALKKAPLAFGLAAYPAGRRFGLNPQQLLSPGRKALAATPGGTQGARHTPARAP